MRHCTKKTQFSEVGSQDDTSPIMSSSVPMQATHQAAPASRRPRSSSTSKRRKKKSPTRRAVSMPTRRPPVPRALRVKSQYESLQTRGLSPSVNRGSHVEFAFLEVREYPIILGDNPSCMEGPPITIDWAHDPNTQFILDVNTFERMRGDRRDSGQLLISKAVREKRLMKCGVSRNDIVKVVRQVRRDKHHRMVSSQQTNLDPMHETIEKASAGFKKMFVFRKTNYEKTLEAATINMTHALSA